MRLAYQDVSDVSLVKTLLVVAVPNVSQIEPVNLETFERIQRKHRHGPTCEFRFRI